MKAVRIDFIPRRSWIGVWVVAALILLGMLALGTSDMVATMQEMQILDAKVISMRATLDKTGHQTQIQESPQTKSIAIANQALQLDLNKPFAALENMAIPGVLLVSASLDMANDGMRVEYALESMAKAVEVTDYLNSGYDARPWVMESVTSSIGSPAAMGAISGAATATAKGIWSVKLKML